MAAVTIVVCRGCHDTRCRCRPPSSGR